MSANSKTPIDQRTITDNLGVTRGSELAPRLPIILVEGVLDGDDGVLGGQVVVVLGELFTGQPLGGVRVGVLRGESASLKVLRSIASP